jgi:hypothetical protein
MRAGWNLLQGLALFQFREAQPARSVIPVYARPPCLVAEEPNRGRPCVRTPSAAAQDADAGSATCSRPRRPQSGQLAHRAHAVGPFLITGKQVAAPTDFTLPPHLDISRRDTGWRRREEIAVVEVRTCLRPCHHSHSSSPAKRSRPEGDRFAPITSPQPVGLIPFRVHSGRQRRAGAQRG